MQEREAEILTPPVEEPAARATNLYAEGIAAGLIGAAAIAVWFLILDTVAGRPLYTPSVLGTALFQRRWGTPGVEGVEPAIEMVLAFTWVHGLVFGIIGVVAALLVGAAERNPDLSFGIVLLFVLFEFGFIVVAMLFAQPLLAALTWPAILIGNFLAAGAMAAYFLRRHPNLRMRP